MLPKNRRIPENLKLPVSRLKGPEERPAAHSLRHVSPGTRLSNDVSLGFQSGHGHAKQYEKRGK